MKPDTKFLTAGAALASNLVAAIALAQDTGDRATSFQAGAHQDIPGGTLLVAAYATVLVVLALYVVYLAAMQQSAAKELTRIAALLEKKVAEKAEKKAD